MDMKKFHIFDSSSTYNSLLRLVWTINCGIDFIP